MGSVQPWTRRIVSVVQALGGPPDASVIHEDWRTDVSRAAFANGVLIGAFECEPLTGSHASGTVLPAALAICQRERFDGARFLAALALGFEVSARIARTAVGLEAVRGFHNPGTQGPFGAAAAVGRLYAFDEEHLTSALGIAGSSSAGLLEFAWSGGDTKRLHLGRASQLGLGGDRLRRWLHAKRGIESKTGEQRPRKNIADRNGDLVPEPPVAERDRGSQEHPGRYDEHIDDRVLIALSEERENGQPHGGESGRRR